MAIFGITVALIISQIRISRLESEAATGRPLSFEEVARQFEQQTSVGGVTVKAKDGASRLMRSHAAQTTCRVSAASEPSRLRGTKWSSTKLRIAASVTTNRPGTAGRIINYYFVATDTTTALPC